MPFRGTPQPYWAKLLWLMGNQRHNAKSNVHTMGIVPARQRLAEFSLALVLVEALVEALLVVLVVQPSRERSQPGLRQPSRERSQPWLRQVWWQHFGLFGLGSEQQCHG